MKYDRVFTRRIGPKNSQALERNGLEQLVEGSRAAGQGDNGARVLHHEPLALLEIVHHTQFADVFVAHVRSFMKRGMMPMTSPPSASAPAASAPIEPTAPPP